MAELCDTDDVPGVKVVSEVVSEVPEGLEEAEVLEEEGGGAAAVGAGGEVLARMGVGVVVVVVGEGEGVVVGKGEGGSGEALTEALVLISLFL